MDLATIEASARAGAYRSYSDGGGDAPALRRDVAQIWRACEVCARVQYRSASTCASRKMILIVRFFPGGFPRSPCPVKPEGVQRRQQRLQRERSEAR